MDVTFAVVIPTYKRVNLLRNLVSDISRQTLLPHELILVDGDSDSDNVLLFFEGMAKYFKRVVYVPSVHGNAPFQRYLGACKVADSRIIVFLDDDIRIPDSTFFEKLLLPFSWRDRYVVGVSPIIDFPNRNVSNHPKNIESGAKSVWKTKPGEITPLGNRIEPENFGEDYSTVRWLRGGVMAYRFSDLMSVIYNEDVFSLSHIRCGLGVDDTVLSREVGAKGELLLAYCAHVIHPDTDSSKAYPVDAFRLAYARAYSRRFINDHYRITRPPTLQDRLALVISLLGNTFLSWLTVIKHRRRADFKYASGYTIGTLRAFFQKPVARVLTPGIDWKSDAQEALSHSITI